MLPVPNYVYQCPNCGNFLTKESLTSGNTFGAKMFSDGKKIAPMLTEFPEITKCKKCEAIFWLSKMEEIGKYPWGRRKGSNWENADDAKFLNIEDYFRALNEGLAENMQDELFIRQRIWWAYNDRIRNGNSLFVDENDEIKWRENCNKLISILDLSNLNQKIMLAELKRNLGNFKDCLDIIETIDNEALNWLKEKFIDECEQENKWLIQLN